LEDDEIVLMYLNRKSEAIIETAKKYGRYCKTIAFNVLQNHEDAEECVNDTYLNTWNAIPPHCPSMLSAFLGKITRNLCYNRYKSNTAQKRGGTTMDIVLEELQEQFKSADQIDDELKYKELCLAINCFLEQLPEVECNVFIRRYWYVDPINSIASRYCLTESKVSSMLFRTRKRLKSKLVNGGIL